MDARVRRCPPPTSPSPPSTVSASDNLAEAFAPFPCINDHSHVVAEPEPLPVNPAD